MKVTPNKKKFGRYEVGTEFDLPDATAKILIKVGKLLAAPTYQTRMMQADVVVAPVVVAAPYGYKADGTPRKRPGRQAK